MGPENHYTAGVDTDLSILLVDDSDITLKLAIKILGVLDLPVFTVSNGREAWEFMHRQPADILITDIMMPEMNGFELIGLLRQEPRFQQTYIVVMTALDRVEDKVKALELGANDYVVKPLEASEFRARVRTGVREMRLKRDLNRAMELLDYELKLVARLQHRLLPKSLPEGENFESAVLYLPASRAGGDYYDFFLDARGRQVVAVADVSGHGASAAVLMGMLRALLKVLVVQGDTAAEVMVLLNRALLENIGDDPDFISILIGLIDEDRRRLNFCSAGHGYMLLMGPAKGELRSLPSGGTVLGCFETDWQDDFVDLSPNQSLVLYTDGLIEVTNEEGEEFGRGRLEDLLRRVEPGGNPAELVVRIKTEVTEFARRTIFPDDLTLFIIKFK